MDMTQAALWVDIIRESPAATLIAADWFEEQNRADLGRFLRQCAAEGREALAGHELEFRYLSLRFQVEIGIRDISYTHPMALLAQVASLQILNGEQFVGHKRPSRFHRGPYLVPAICLAESSAEMAYERLLLEEYRFGGKRVWREESAVYHAFVWAGRSSTGVLHFTSSPEPDEFHTTFS